MLDPHSTILRTGMGILIAPAVAIVLYGTARLLALALARWIPESTLKRRLLTDTGRLAYKPRPQDSPDRDETSRNGPDGDRGNY